MEEGRRAKTAMKILNDIHEMFHTGRGTETENGNENIVQYK